jgi:serine/threonine protein kinase
MDTSAENSGISLDAADDVWDQLAEWLEGFAEAWHQDGESPALADFVPAEPAELRRLALVELVKLDLEYRSEAGHSRRPIEDYCREFPELSDGGVPADLLYEEFHIRRSAGEAVRPEEYEQRFPDQKEALRQLVQLDSPTSTTALLATVPPADLQPGDQLDDFDLLARLGKGAFATVFLARQRSLQRMVAVKISSNRGSEPQTLAQLDHPNIVRVYDQRVLPDRDLRLLYMKCVPGGTLEQAIAWSQQTPHEARSGKSLLEAVSRALDLRGETPPAESAARERLESADWPETVCRVGFQLALALDYAHARGVLHRDLKPANILLTAEAVPQLVDFNISFCSKLEGATPAAYFGGSLAYMSPEQLEACDPTHPRSPESLTGASDVYSLGVVLWEMLSGVRPFADEQLSGGWSQTLAVMVQRRKDGPCESTLQSQVGALREMVPVLAKCLHADPERRYPSAGELANDLRLCLHPEARQLVRPAKDSWVIRGRRLAMLVLLATAVGPNVPTAVFNYFYNLNHIMRRFPESYSLFWNTQTIVNSIAFPVGIAIVVALIWPVTRAIHGRAAARPLAWLRHRSLRIGHFIAILAIIEWSLAAMVYPLALHLVGAQLTPADNMHFFGSLLLCGLVAAAYPFFFATAFSVRVIYPAFVEPFHMRFYDVADLERLQRWTWLYLALGLLVPMLAVVLMVTLGGEQYRVMLAVVSGSSLAGFVLLVGLTRYLEITLGKLREVSGVADKRDA